MCGIAGIFHVSGGAIEPDAVGRMVACLRHRGPDGDGTFFGDGIALGHTRLAIIDLSHDSDQPFRDEAAGLTLIFNGEIYNYVELRAELRELGHEFRTAGDTEVLLKAYEQWGPGCLSRLNGMFALAIWNERTNELFLARDRFGKKPLYLTRRDGQVVFASEMKAILAVRPELRTPNLRSVYRYLVRGDLDLDAETFFHGIENLPAAHYVTLDREGRGEPRPYWEPWAAEVPKSRAEAIAGFRELLFDAVRIRLRSDVPVGSSLSGGIDSSSIVAAIHALREERGVEHQRTFSARFRSPRHDEGQYIARLTGTLDVDAHDVWVEPEGFLEDFAKLQYHQEEPIASTSPYAQWLVMRLARENQTTVLLDGQGADELLAGYSQAHGMFLAHWLRRGRIDRVGREMVAYGRRYHGFREPLMFGAYYSMPGKFRDRLAARLFGGRGVVSPDLERQFAPAHAEAPAPFPDRLRNELVRWQTTTQLPELLRYADRNSMAFGREARMPFLDHRLAEYCMGLPPTLLLEGATTKLVLREAMRGYVPDEILDRRDKVAFSPPQQRWNHTVLRPWIESMVSAAMGREGVFEAEAVGKVLREFQGGKGDTIAWRIASAEAWFQAFIDQAAAGSPGGK